MSNPYAFLTGLQLGNQASGSSGVGAMQLSHNIALSGLGPFPGLNFQGGGQGIPALPFPMQAGSAAMLQNQLGLGLSGMIPAQRPQAVGVSHQGPGDFMPRGQTQEQDSMIPKTKENDKAAGQNRAERVARKDREHGRKRARSGSNGDSDDDIMVLSNSPSSSNDTSDRREGGPSQTKVWDNPPVMGLVTANGALGFPISANPLVNGSLTYPPDPSSLMAAIGPQMQYEQFGLMPGVVANVANPPKEPIHLKSCTLFPPNPQAPPPTTRERPLGCRTVFVGGLPENTTEEVLKEIFERCGEIATIRMSKKNFAHVRFERECYVDNAISLSGYRVRLNNQKADAASVTSGSGRLHVDFAQARDDQYEFECQQRRLEREMRHRQKIEEEKWRPPSPPPVPHYAEHEAHVVVEQLKSEERFGRAVQILATWLERGDCSKRNSNGFYSMIQSAHAHLRRLSSEKSQLEEEAKRTHDSLRQKFVHLITQLGEMERLFQAASHQKAWDHFTKAQRKSLESWKKHVMDLKSLPTVEFLMASGKGDDNMDLSDSESEEPRRYKSDGHDKNIANLKEENDSLRCQLEAYKNEVEIVRSDLKSELQLKDQQIKIMEETIKNLERRAQHQTAVNEQIQSQSSQSEASEQSSNPSDARLVSLISVYLSIHHLGSSVDSIVNYLQKTDSSLVKEDVDRVLRANSQLFARSNEDTPLWRYKLFFQ